MALCAAVLYHSPPTGALAITHVLVTMLDNSLGVWLFLSFAVEAGLPPALQTAGERCWSLLPSFVSPAAAATGHEPCGSATSEAEEARQQAQAGVMPGKMPSFTFRNDVLGLV